MALDYTKTFSSEGNRAEISDADWIAGWVEIVGGINGIPTAQQFNAINYIIESKANEAHSKASSALTSLEDKVDKVDGSALMTTAQSAKLAGIAEGATKTASNATNGYIFINGVATAVYAHPTGEGNEHIPAGGTTGQALIRTDDGYTWGSISPTDVESPIKNATAETTIADADTVPFTDVSDSSTTKKITWENLKAVITAAFSGVYAAASHTHDDRYYTETEMDSKLSGKVGTSGDGSSTTVTFTEATDRATPLTGETQATLWGKMKKMYSDLKTVAFTGAYTDLTSVPTSFTPSTHTHAATDITSETLGVARGGTGASTHTSGNFLKGAGTSAVTSVTAAVARAQLGIGYGTCSTAAATAAKTVTLSNFALSAGAHVSVYFTYGNTNTASTLNINSTGAKQIWIQGERIDGSAIEAGDLVHLVYDGTYYRILSVDRASAWTPPTFAAATWDEVELLSERGDASDFWAVGDTKDIVLSSGETITVRIEDFEHDTLSAGGTAGITIGMVNNLNTTNQMNTSNTNVGGWGSSAMKTYMSTLKALLPTDLQAVIKTVTKTTQAGNKLSTLTTTTDDLWLFSYTEVGLTSTTYSPGGEGTVYPLFVSDASRIKTTNGSAAYWWLRSPYLANTTHFCLVVSSGSNGSTYASSSYGVSVGFCI